ncbi:MAG TPA: ATP synthase F1 subunit epsilon [Firmicutes bacterium]|nr:ATP synthase F1 subunit epsilon [Bacillota bacterium]
MATFPLQVLTPERVVYEAEVDGLTVRTTAGDVGILRGHADYVAAIDIGFMQIRIGNQRRTAALSNGMLRVNRQKAVILVQACEWADEIDLERARRAEQAARQRLAAQKSDQDMALAEVKLKRALNRQQIAQKK